MEFDGYTYDTADFATLLLQKQYHERTQGESAVIKAFLLRHLQDYDRIIFGKRVGRGLTPNPSHLEGVQQNTVFSSMLRIDILAWRDSQPVLIEVKQRVTPSALGQILTYRHHFVEEFPGAPEPELVVVGREAVDDAVVALQAHNVTVYLYADAIAGGAAAGGSV